MNMYEVLMPTAILGTISLGIYLFTKTLTDYYLKKKMVENGYVNEENQSLFKNQDTTDKYGALKWGLIVFFGALGLILIDVIPSRHDSPLPFGIFALCLSFGFLTYFMIAKYLTKKE
jgi:hypothetical protein